MMEKQPAEVQVELLKYEKKQEKSGQTNGSGTKREIENVKVKNSRYKEGNVINFPPTKSKCQRHQNGKNFFQKLKLCNIFLL